MKFTDFLYPLLFAFVTTFLLQQFFFKKDNLAENSQIAGQEYIAPATQVAAKPLNLEVDFYDAKPRDYSEVKSEIKTSYGNFVFSSNGAALDSLNFLIKKGSQDLDLQTISQIKEIERSRQAFIVALNEKTPYFYNLVNQEDNSEFSLLNYRSETDSAIVNKVYKVYKNICKIDLELQIQPLLNKADNSTLQARILFPVPYLDSLGDKEVINAIVYTDKNSIKKIAAADVGTRFWSKPSLVGAEDKYFIHALVRDSESFVERAYYKPIGQDRLTVILESSDIKESKNYNLSFYIGPKEVQTISQVEPKLESTLDYGVFNPISKFLLSILKFLYKYLNNYGLAIIFLTLLMKLLMVPLTLNGNKAMARQREMQKKLQYLEQKYRHDKEQLAIEKTELIRKQGIPDMLGCLPMLLQIPIFVALSRVLSGSLELYQSPFLWIQDLSKPDMLVLPLLLCIGMLLQAAITPGDTRQRLSQVLMGLVFAALASNFSAGLALFICVSTWATVLQTKSQEVLKI